jgi:hypothetical protein
MTADSLQPGQPAGSHRRVFLKGALQLNSRGRFTARFHHFGGRVETVPSIAKDQGDCENRSNYPRREALLFHVRSKTFWSNIGHVPSRHRSPMNAGNFAMAGFGPPSLTPGYSHVESSGNGTNGHSSWLLFAAIGG